MAGLTVPEKNAAAKTALRELIQLAPAIRTMADTVDSLQQEIRALRAAVAQLEKVTPAQVRILNAAVSDRARELGAQYALDGDRALRTAIRRSIRMEMGARSTREIARCDYEVAMDLIATWEDPAVIRALMDREGD